MVDQLPCGSVLTPAISCTKLKIHSCRQFHGQNTFRFSIFREDQSLLHRPRSSGREWAWWNNSLVGQCLHQLSLVQSSRSIQHMLTVPWRKQTFFLFTFLWKPVFASQTKKLRKRMSMMNQLPCGSVLTPAISCTKLKIYSAHADSPMAKIVFISLFLGRTSLCFTHQEENEHGGPTLLWVSAYNSFCWCKAQDPSSTCIQFHSQITFSFSLIFWEDQSLLHRPGSSGRERAWWTNSLVGQCLLQLSLAQSSRSIQHMQTVPWPKHFLFLYF